MLEATAVVVVANELVVVAAGDSEHTANSNCDVFCSHPLQSVSLVSERMPSFLAPCEIVRRPCGQYCCSTSPRLNNKALKDKCCNVKKPMISYTISL
jgi:hypothetical protein